MEDEAEMIEDAPPILRSKRRLILTTQLMQQLFHAPPAVLLSVDASSQYDSVAYFAARLALGDACCAISCSGNDALLPPNSKNLYELLNSPFMLIVNHIDFWPILF